ncbi:SH3 domain-containing protein [Streptomyces sp. CA-210063]|uniref:SH3 domain-containing protein n=1 Tax=Streptomyces sp. CA-210063 TaxID=2801029 RepID=UPI00214B1F31|nr:SH3 domain-containing protein [Streptomyces sp. CA-210063]UUU31755.1 SH3 domain-containing protein [Streptomyces sp. CA-210063]
MSVDQVEEIAGDGEGEQTAKASAEATTTATAATATAAVRYYSVAPGVRLNVRSGPSTSYRIVRVLSEGASVPIFCQTPGQTISGPYGTTNIWDNIDDGEYISDAYVHTGSDGYVAPRCG